MNSQKRILLLAVRAGKIIMCAGGEIYRVEETISRICKAYGMDYVNVFAIPTGIFVSVDRDDGEKETFTYVKRIRSSEADINRISKINNFSRIVSTQEISVEEAEQMLEEIEKERKYPFALRLIAAAFVTSCFCMIFGGKAVDFWVAFVVGLVCYTFSRFLEKYSVNFFIRGMACCFLGSLITLAAVASLEGASYMPIISGGIMLFVPGLALTTSIRDFLSGDMTSGISRLAETLLIAISLAMGTALAFLLWAEIGGYMV